MSNPANPLDKLNAFSTLHVLVAFEYGENANIGSKNTLSNVDPGDPLPGFSGCGGAYVVVNELYTNRFQIPVAKWDYSFYSPRCKSVSSSVGLIKIISPIDASFYDFMYLKILPKLGGIGLSHVTFALKTFFVGEDDSGAPLVITGNPWIFHCMQLVHGGIETRGGSIYLQCASDSYTLGQMPSFSSLFQTTITHKDGNLHDEIPQPDPAGCVPIKTRAEEDSVKTKPRKNRLDKSKPMKNLKDVFDAFKVELNQQKYVNKAQLQQWLRNVRDDHVDKIEVPPIQEKGPFGDFLPIDYEIDLDDVYESYPIDNRNLPFEQPEQDQTINGIRTLTVPPGIDITNYAQKLMLLSTKIGDDTRKSEPLVPVFSISCYRKCDSKYLVTLKIRQIKLPKNVNKGEDTGPGEGAINELDYYINFPSNPSDSDIDAIDGKLSYRRTNDVIEVQTEDPNAKVIFGNREQTTVEKDRDIDFFNTMYSGQRIMKDVDDTYGLENASKATDLGALNSTQYSLFSVRTKGNSDLLNDINRIPPEVASDSPGTAKLYQFPEYYPIYARVFIGKESMDIFGINPPEEQTDFPLHYYVYYYHVSKITNVFDRKEDENSDGATFAFNQILEMRRTDEFM